MAVPAYRYDRMPATRTAPQTRRPAPAVRVVPGRKSANPTLSDAAVTLLKVAMVLMAVFLVVSFLRVGLASAAYSAASASTSLSSQIEDARSEGESLAVQKSLISNPGNLRTAAQEKLQMTYPESVGTLVMPVDVVAVDDSGTLSLTQSLSRLSHAG